MPSGGDDGAPTCDILYLCVVVGVCIIWDSDNTTVCCSMQPVHAMRTHAVETGYCIVRVIIKRAMRVRVHTRDQPHHTRVYPENMPCIFGAFVVQTSRRLPVADRTDRSTEVKAGNACCCRWPPPTAGYRC